MIFLISGASHTGKTLLSQKLIEKHRCGCVSLDLLKMGLIRSGNTTLTPFDDEELVDYLWPIAREMARTALENEQDLIIEGCYIPASWQQDFTPDELAHIQGIMLVMSEHYIREHFDTMKAHANDAERRLDDSDFTLEAALADNAEMQAAYEANDCPYVLIEGEYNVDLLI